MRVHSYVGAVLVAGLMLSPLFFGLIQPSRPLPEGEVTMRTDKLCYELGEPVHITASGWGRVPSIGDFPDVFWAIVDSQGFPVFETFNPADIWVNFSGTFTATWNQTYRLANNTPPSGDPVPPGRYVIWFYEIPWPVPSWPYWRPAVIAIGDCDSNLRVLTDKDCYAPGEDVIITLLNAGPEVLTWYGQPPAVSVFNSSGMIVKMPLRETLPFVVTVNPNQTYPWPLKWNQTYYLYDVDGSVMAPSYQQVPEGTYTIFSWADWPQGVAGMKKIQILSNCGSTAPTADAGLDQTVNEGDAVQLDGSRSKGSIVTTGGKLPRIANYSCPWPSSGNPGWPSEPESPYDNLVKNGNFEQGLNDWTTVGSVSVSHGIVYNGSSSLFVNTSASDNGFIYQRIGDPGAEYVMYVWIYLVSARNDPLVLELISNWDPSTGHADVTARFNLFSDRMEWTMWNKVVGYTTPNPFTPNSWHRLVFALNSSEKAMCWWVDDSRAECAVLSYVAPFAAEYLMLGDVSWKNHAGIIYFDNMILVGLKDAGTTEAPITSYAWDLNNQVDSNGDGNFTNDVDATGPNPTHVYGDDGVYTVTLTVTDDTGQSDTDTCIVTVLNLPPEIDEVNCTIQYSTAGAWLRIAGEKWHDVTATLYRNGTEVGTAILVRRPGSPNEQEAFLGTVDVYADYSALVRYTPDDDPINGQPNGANPAWIILRLDDGSEKRIHHTFNVRHPETWNWTVTDLQGYLAGRRVTCTATATDPGSDDLTFEWDWGDGSPPTATAHYNDGVGPDPYPSPGGTFPYTATDRQSHAYMTAGRYELRLRVSDDDDGASELLIVQILI